jgi:hypothetical protein
MSNHEKGPRRCLRAWKISTVRGEGFGINREMGKAEDLGGISALARCGRFDWLLKDKERCAIGGKERYIQHYYFAL